MVSAGNIAQDVTDCFILIECALVYVGISMRDWRFRREKREDDTSQWLPLNYGLVV